MKRQRPSSLLRSGSECVRGRSTIAKCPRRKLGWLVFTAGALILLGAAVPLVLRHSRPPKQVFPDFEEVNAPVIQLPTTLAADSVQLADDTEVVGVEAGGRKRAYVLEALFEPRDHCVNDVLGGTPRPRTHGFR